MSTVKQGKSVRKNVPVKQTNTKRVVIAVLLALAGLIIYLISYQYTHQAKLEADLKAKQSQVQSQLQQLNTTKSLNAEQQKKIDDLNKQNQDLQKQLQAKIATKTAYAESAPLPVVTGDKTAWMSQAGIPESDWGYVDFIVGHEGGWNGTTKYNYAGSGAYGLCQSLPGSKMASAGSDWMTNPVTQLKWCNGYANRYGGWYGSYVFWKLHSWW